MTREEREEIIAILESYKKYEDNRTEDSLHHGYDNTKEAKRRKEALDEAIKALSLPEPYKGHDLKICPKYFDDVKRNKKQFEIRKDDRNYQVGDLITLREWDNGQYTGREIKNIPIRYILRNVPEYGLKEGYCILGL